MEMVRASVEYRFLIDDDLWVVEFGSRFDAGGWSVSIGRAGSKAADRWKWRKVPGYGDASPTAEQAAGLLQMVWEMEPPKLEVERLEIEVAPGPPLGPYDSPEPVQEKPANPEDDDFIPF